VEPEGFNIPEVPILQIEISWLLYNQMSPNKKCLKSELSGIFILESMAEISA